MILYIVLAIVLWFVAPLFIDGHVKNNNDRKALRLLSRIIAVSVNVCLNDLSRIFIILIV